MLSCTWTPCFSRAGDRRPKRYLWRSAERASNSIVAEEKPIEVGIYPACGDSLRWLGIKLSSRSQLLGTDPLAGPILLRSLRPSGLQRHVVGVIVHIDARHMHIAEAPARNMNVIRILTDYNGSLAPARFLPLIGNCQR